MHFKGICVKKLLFNLHHCKTFENKNLTQSRWAIADKHNFIVLFSPLYFRNFENDVRGGGVLIAIFFYKYTCILEKNAI